ncbi:MAG: glutathione S-transferase, partial [Planctomycetes bacterium]|nr:glutathione S-transferase [Planctomycetota bacterium]
AEYVAEHFPEARLWPEDTVARARARSIASEMHAGFAHLRRELPMNCRARRTRRARSAGVDQDVARVLDCWRSTLRNFGGDGPFLFGDFTIADAFFAPVACRFFTYDVEVDDTGADYLDTLFSIPAMQQWMCDAESEPMVIAEYDAVE